MFYFLYLQVYINLNNKINNHIKTNKIFINCDVFNFLEEFKKIKYLLGLLFKSLKIIYLILRCKSHWIYSNIRD